MFIFNNFSTCLGHHYAHLQENKTYVNACVVLRWFCWMWLVAVVGRCLVGCEHCEGYCRTVTVTSRTDTMTSQNIDLSSWDTLYTHTHTHIYINKCDWYQNFVFYVAKWVVLGAIVKHSKNKVICIWMLFLFPYPQKCIKCGKELIEHKSFSYSLQLSLPIYI